MGQVQYTPLTGPVRVPAASETITLDKWAPTYPGRVVTRPGRARQEFTEPLLITATPDQTPAGAWVPTLARTGLRPTQSRAHGYTWQPATPAAAVGADGMSQQGGSQTMRPVTIQYQSLTGPMRQPNVLGIGPIPDYIPPCMPDVPTRRPVSAPVRILVQPIFGVLVDVPVMSWTGLYLDRTSSRRRQAAAKGGSNDPQFTNIIPPVLPDLSWLSASVLVPQRRRTLRRRVMEWVAPPWEAVLPVLTGWGRLLGFKRNRLVNKR